MTLKFEQTGLGAFGLITIDGQLHGSVSPELAAWIVAMAEANRVASNWQIEFGPALTASTEVEI